MVVHGGEQLACTAVGVLGSDGTGRGDITGVGVVGVALAGGGVAKSGPVGAGAFGGVAWRFWEVEWTGWSCRASWLGGRQCDGDDQRCRSY